jgi:hypothetical protein
MMKFSKLPLRYWARARNHPQLSVMPAKLSLTLPRLTSVEQLAAAWRSMAQVSWFAEVRYV